MPCFHRILEDVGVKGRHFKYDFCRLNNTSFRLRQTPHHHHHHTAASLKWSSREFIPQTRKGWKHNHAIYSHKHSHVTHTHTYRVRDAHEPRAWSLALSGALMAACGLTEIYERCKLCGGQNLSTAPFSMQGHRAAKRIDTALFTFSTVSQSVLSARYWHFIVSIHILLFYQSVSCHWENKQSQIKWLIA